MIDPADGNDGENQVHDANHYRLQHRGIGAEAHAAENLGGVVEHHVDAHELLQDRQPDADQDDGDAKGKERAPALTGIADLGTFAGRILGAVQILENVMACFTLAAKDEPARALGNRFQQPEKQQRGRRLDCEHDSPAGGEVPCLVTLDGNAVIAEVGGKYPGDDGELVVRNQPAADRSGRDLGDVHRGADRGQTHADAADYPVENEQAVEMRALPDGRETELRDCGTERRYGEQDGAQSEDAPRAETLTQYRGDRAADDTAEQRTRHQSAETRARLKLGESEWHNEVLIQGVHRTRDHRRVVTEQQPPECGDQSYAVDVSLAQDHGPPGDVSCLLACSATSWQQTTVLLSYWLVSGSALTVIENGAELTTSRQSPAQGSPSAPPRPTSRQQE